jgi:hypothetical protein
VLLVESGGTALRVALDTVAGLEPMTLLTTDDTLEEHSIINGTIRKNTTMIKGSMA